MLSDPLGDGGHVLGISDPYLGNSDGFWPILVRCIFR